MMNSKKQAIQKEAKTISDNAIDLVLEQITRLCTLSGAVLEKQINDLEKLPEIKVPGHLVKSSRNGSPRWKRILSPEESESGKTEVISMGKAEDGIIRTLAAKLYRQCSIAVRKGQLEAVNAYLRKSEKIPKYSRRIVTDQDILGLLSPQSSLQEKIVKWQNAAYQKNPAYPEKLKIHAENGLMVRSKSEAIIVSELTRKGIPFRYECALQLKNRIVYPDFMICHPVTGKLYLWEHFGMMDDPVYADKAGHKVAEYVQCGYALMVNLIVTSETKEHPLDYAFVRILVEYFFSLSV